MKLWITGGGGFLATALAQLCNDNNINFIASKKEDADITNLDHLTRFSKNPFCQDVSHIINCAAFTDLELAEKNPAQAFLVNATGAENVGLIAKALKAKIIHISTDYVFNGEQQIPYTELDECHPINVYADSKREGEKKLLNVHPSACVIRSSWLFGKGGKNFISSVLEKMQKESTLRIVSDQKGRPTFVNDLAGIILQLLSYSGIYHFSNTGEVSRFDMAQEILNKAKALNIKLTCQEIIPIPSSTFPTLAPRPSYSVLNTNKVELTLKSKPRPWTDALNEYLCSIKTS